MIAQRHSIPLTTAVTASTPGRLPMVEALYHEATELFLGHERQGGSIARVRRVLSPTSIEAEVVDLETGIFLRLTGSLDTAQSPPKITAGPFIVYGKILVWEIQNAQLQNTSTKIWR